MSDLRANLRGSIAASAAPYGYTITIWSSGAMAMHVLDDPEPYQVLLFLAGASVAFLLTAVIAYGTLVADLESAPVKRVSLLGATHVLSAGLPVLAVWGVTTLAGEPVGWPLGGFVATAGYLVATSAQTTAASPGEGP
jgi:hypothetical protein